jgi:hypothetical protein
MRDVFVCVHVRYLCGQIFMHADTHEAWSHAIRYTRVCSRMYAESYMAARTRACIYTYVHGSCTGIQNIFDVHVAHVRTNSGAKLCFHYTNIHA